MKMNKPVEKSLISIFLYVLMIVILAQILNSALTVATFERSYRRSLISQYGLISAELIRKIETQIHYEKPVYLIDEMDGYISALMSRYSDISKIDVTLPNGKILYSSRPETIGRVIRLDTQSMISDLPENRHSLYFLNHNGNYMLVQDVKKNQVTVANIYLEFEREKIIRRIVRLIVQFFYSFLMVFLLSGLAALAGIVLLKYFNQSRKVRIRIENQFFFITVLLMIVSQTVLSMINLNDFQKAYREVIKENQENISQILVDEFENALRYGLDIHHLHHAESVLKRYLNNNPECFSLSVSDSDDRFLYYSDHHEQTAYTESRSAAILNQKKQKMKSEEALVFRYPVRQNGKTAGYLYYEIDQELIAGKIRNLLIDSLTIIVVSVVLSFEFLLIFILRISNLSELFSAEHQSPDDSRKTSLIRFTAFLLFFTELIPLSFIPLFSRSLYQSSGFLSKVAMPGNIIISLPISLYILGTSAGIIWSGLVSGKRNIRHYFMISGFLILSGAMVGLLSVNILMLSIGRFISGTGFGIASINAVQLIIGMTRTSHRSRGFGNWAAGFASAMICAVSIGGVIVGRFGFRAGMFASVLAALMFLRNVFVNINHTDRYDENKNKNYQLPEKKEIKLFSSELLMIFKDRNIMASLLFSTLPYQLAYIGTFQFILPLYMNQNQISQSNIGRIMTLFGIVNLFIPIISSFADKWKNDRFFLILGNMLMGFFLMLFIFSENILMFILVMTGLGVGSMMGDAVEESFVTSTAAAAKIGEVKLMSVYSMIEKLISAVLPISAGILVSVFQFHQGIIMIGGILVFSSLVLALFTDNPRKMINKGDSIEKTR